MAAAVSEYEDTEQGRRERVRKMGLRMRFLYGPWVSNAYEAAVRMSIDLPQLCVWFVGIRTCGLVRGMIQSIHRVVRTFNDVLMHGVGDAAR